MKFSTIPAIIRKYIARIIALSSKVLSTEEIVKHYLMRHSLVLTLDNQTQFQNEISQSHNNTLTVTP